MFSDALVITRREIRNTVRDLRIVMPIIILALVFPYVMEVASRMAVSLSQRTDNVSLPSNFIPFVLLLVGFFPVSIALVIALESFAGEKERNSLEPMFASPLSDTSIYIGKLLAATLLPLLASYLAIAAYLITLYFSTQYFPNSVVLLQIILLTSVEAVMMVAGAVVISSHATSVRAANLLASFIIIPTAFLVQGESLLLFWEYSSALWWILAILVVVGIILIRMGLATFNREEILTREMDEFNWRRIGMRFRKHLFGEQLSLREIYLKDLPHLLYANRLPLGIALLVSVGALILGVYAAGQYPLSGLFTLTHIQPGFETTMQFPGEGLPGLNPFSLFVHNTRALLLATLLAVFTFGSGAVLVLAAPLALIGFFTGEAALLGMNPALFLLAFILPHGVVELPAAILATTFALRLGAAIISPPGGKAAGEHFIQALAEWIKVFIFLVLPLLLVSAFLEVWLTPRVIAFIFGG